MRNGYNGRVLHVDLTEGRWWAEELDELIYRTYLGGSTLSAYFLLRDLKPGVDPLGPDNLLILMTSVINGLPLSGANRYTAAGKSPLTGGFGEAEAGGYWGPELKRAGFDGIIVHGRAARPVYLFVHDGECEVRDAGQYWGQLSGEVQAGLEDELGDKRICVLQTGVAGENGVRLAAMTNQLRHFHGRAGLGAVMGGKNLKAIVVRGRARLTEADRDAARSVLRWFKEAYDHETDVLHIHGTAQSVVPLDLNGLLRDYVNAVTGWDMSLFEMMKVGERANTMARLFNLREGFTAADDTLPQRMFEPLRNGALAGQALDADEFTQALRLYYQMAGWDDQGVPIPAKLAELGLNVGCYT